jgi:hypothetical protein
MNWKHLPVSRRTWSAANEQPENVQDVRKIIAILGWKPKDEIGINQGVQIAIGDVMASSNGMEDLFPIAMPMVGEKCAKIMSKKSTIGQYVTK